MSLSIRNFRERFRSPLSRDLRLEHRELVEKATSCVQSARARLPAQATGLDAKQAIEGLVGRSAVCEGARYCGFEVSDW